MAHPDGMFGWDDLAVPDTAAAADFYGQVMGWEAVEFPSPGEMPYTFFTRGGKTAAGMGRLSEEQQDAGVPPVWSSYIAVDDAEDVVKRAADLGAEVMMPAMDVMSAGKMAFLADPTGAAFGLWQAGEHQGSDAFNEPGFMTWNELATRDTSSVVGFCTALFGWGVEVQDHDGFVYTTSTRGDRPNGGTFDRKNYAPPELPAHWAAYFAIDDIDRAVETARGLGATIAREPTDSEFGRMAVVLDPQGAMFEIIELTRLA